MASLDECKRSCNTLDNFFGRICAPSNAENVILNVSNIITK